MSVVYNGKNKDTLNGKSSIKKKTVPGYVLIIVINLIFYYLVDRLDSHDVAFLTERFSILVQVFKVAIIATIVSNAAFIFYDENWFKAPVRLATSLLGIYFMANLLIVFPFNFSTFNVDYFPSLVRFALGAGVVAGLIGALAEFFKTIRQPFDD